MQNGLYISRFVSIGNKANLHEQNLSLWEKQNNHIILKRYWEVARITREKHSSTPFKDKQTYKVFENKLLKHEGVSPKDIIATLPTYPTPKAHLFSAIFIKGSSFFYNSDILALAVDNEPLGAVCKKGQISYFKISSPAFLWKMASKVCGKPEGSLMALASSSISLFDKRFDFKVNLAAYIMRGIQHLSDFMMQRTIAKALKQYHLNPKSTALALSGGFALNCPSNSFLREHFGFKDILIPPCTDNSGQSLGQALRYFYEQAEKEKEKLVFAPLSAYMGQAFTYKHSSRPFTSAQFVKDIETAPIVWFNGNAEIGPRALGNRSILADPRTLKSKEALNKIKRREWWRPVAPIVMEERVGDFFTPAICSPFMLELVKVRSDKISAIPAVVHFDLTARIQTVNKQETPLIYKALAAFYKKTGIPVLCNTSLNDKNEPIINTPEQALSFARKKRIKVAYINGYRYEVQK